MTDEQQAQAERDAVVQAAFVHPPAPHNRTVFLANYNPDWPAWFERERVRIRRTLRDRVLVLEHVGSTSIPGMAAKPRIDMVLGVTDSADEPAYVPDMEAAGYVLTIREPEWYEHRLFKGPDTDINLHVFTAGNVEIERITGFRDWLRSHPEDFELYLARKRELAGRTWRWMQDYADEKSLVVEGIIERANLPRRAPTG